MPWAVLLGGSDKTDSVIANTLSVQQRAGQRHECSVGLFGQVADGLPWIGQDLQVVDHVTREHVGTGNGLETEFSVSGIPVLLNSMSVYFDDATTPESSANYEIDYRTGIITFYVAPELDTEVYVTYAGILFGGVVRNISTHNLEALHGDTTLLHTEVYSDGYHHIPARRTVITDWASIDAGDIVTYLIDTFLVEEGITAGVIDTGALVEQYTRRVVSIKQILDDMANLSGYQWWIDDFKALHFTQETPLYEAPYPIAEEGLCNYYDLRLESRMEHYRNKQFVFGAGDYVYILEDTTEIASRAALGDGSGVYGSVYEDQNISDDTVAIPVANNLQKMFGRIPMNLVFGSAQSYWRSGSRLRVNLPSLGIVADRYFLIDEVTFTDRKLELDAYVTAVSRRSDIEARKSESSVLVSVEGTGVKME